MPESTVFKTRRIEMEDRKSSCGLFRQELPYRAVATLAGALLGLSAPGFDQSYLPWFALTPLLYLTVTAREPWLAGVRGWYFATAFNLVYLNWYLFFRAEFGAGTFAFCPAVMSFLFWVSMAAWQGLFVSIFTCVLNAVPLTGGWLPIRHQGRWRFPSFVAVPLLWVLIDKLCNAPELLGVPWSALEYSQYKNTEILQAASIIGGTGIGACIVLCNVTILSVLSLKRKELRAFSFNSKASLILNTTIALSVLMAIPAYGIYRIASQNCSNPKRLSVTAVQANLNKKIHKCESTKIMGDYIELCQKSPAGSVCVWPEWTMTIDFTQERKTLEMLGDVPGYRKQSWIVGLSDEDNQGREYNSVGAMDRVKKLLPVVYHKRYLVPIGEFTPDWVRETPLGILLYGFNKRYQETTPDNKTVLLRLSDMVVGPMLCFECIMPGLSSGNVKQGAELLVNCSNTSWFHNSILSDQMIAFCTMRAVENHRSFVFSTGLGPSAIIDSVGRNLRQAPREKPAAISAEVPIENDLTLFTRLSAP